VVDPVAHASRLVVHEDEIDWRERPIRRRRCTRREIAKTAGRARSVGVAERAVVVAAVVSASGGSASRSASGEHRHDARRNRKSRRVPNEHDDLLSSEDVLQRAYPIRTAPILRVRGGRKITPVSLRGLKLDSGKVRAPQINCRSFSYWVSGS